MVCMQIVQQSLLGGTIVDTCMLLHIQCDSRIPKPNIKQSTVLIHIYLEHTTLSSRQTFSGYMQCIMQASIA